jgi:hypothetical protein
LKNPPRLRGRIAVAAAIGAVELRPFASKGEHWRTEPEDALQVSEEHLHLLSLMAGESAELSSDRLRNRSNGPILFHGLSQLGLPVACVERRQAYQGLKSLATHKTDRNEARGLAHLPRTGFFLPVKVKSLSAHAIRSLIIARKKLVGQRVTLENQIRGLAVVFGARLPRALTDAFNDQALKASEGIAGLSAAIGAWPAVMARPPRSRRT